MPQPQQSQQQEQRNQSNNDNISYEHDHHHSHQNNPPQQQYPPDASQPTACRKTCQGLRVTVWRGEGTITRREASCRPCWVCSCPAMARERRRSTGPRTSRGEVAFTLQAVPCVVGTPTLKWCLASYRKFRYMQLYRNSRLLKYRTFDTSC